MEVILKNQKERDTAQLNEELELLKARVQQTFLDPLNDRCKVHNNYLKYYL